MDRHGQTSCTNPLRCIAVTRSDAFCLINNVDELGLEFEASRDVVDIDRLVGLNFVVEGQQVPENVEHQQDRTRTAFCVIA